MAQKEQVEHQVHQLPLEHRVLLELTVQGVHLGQVVQVPPVVLQGLVEHLERAVVQEPQVVAVQVERLQQMVQGVRQEPVQLVVPVELVPHQAHLEQAELLVRQDLLACQEIGMPQHQAQLTPFRQLVVQEL
jgi:hypothetical protein